MIELNLLRVSRATSHHRHFNDSGTVCSFGFCMFNAELNGVKSKNPLDCITFKDLGFSSRGLYLPCLPYPPTAATHGWALPRTRLACAHH